MADIAMFKTLFSLPFSSPNSPRASILFLNLYSWLLTLEGIQSLLSTLLTLASLCWVLLQITTKLRERKSNPKTK